MCICHIVSEYKNNLFLSQIKVLFENSVHLSHSFRIESGSRLITASLHHRLAPSPPTSALIVAERRHSAVTRYAERSATCRVFTRPCCRRAGGTPLLQRQSMTARAVSLSVTPRQRRGHTHRRTCAADAPPLAHSYYQSTAAPPCGAYRPLSPTPDAVRG